MTSAHKQHHIVLLPIQIERPVEHAVQHQRIASRVFRACRAAVVGHLDQAVNVSDIVEISEVAKLAAKLREIPEIRTDLVEQVKAEIAAGTYETPERVDIAVERLMEEFFSEY